MFNWSAYVSPDNIEAFKRQSGIDTFGYDTYANNEELIAKLTGGASGYDIAAPSGRVRARDDPAGLHPEAGPVADPERQAHRQCVQGPALGPDRRIPGAQGLRHDRDPVPRQARPYPPSVMAGPLRRHHERVVRQDRLRRLDERCHGLPAQAARLLSQLGRPGPARGGPPDPARRRAAHPVARLRHLPGPPLQRGRGGLPRLGRAIEGDASRPGHRRHGLPRAERGLASSGSIRG